MSKKSFTIEDIVRIQQKVDESSCWNVYDSRKSDDENWKEIERKRKAIRESTTCQT